MSKCLNNKLNSTNLFEIIFAHYFLFDQNFIKTKNEELLKLFKFFDLCMDH